MSLFDSLNFRFWDGAHSIPRLIKQWEPEDCRTEKEFESSLFLFLQKQLPGIQITKQFASGRIKADIVIGKRVILELKTNLKTTSQLQRLLGQLVLYRDWNGKIIIVLTGETDQDLLIELKKSLKNQFEDFDFTDPFNLDAKILITEKALANKIK